MSSLAPRTEYGPAEGGNFSTNWQGTYLNAQLISDVGKKREKNEDACIFCAPEDAELLERNGCLFAVADGMGGASAGERASRMALQELVQSYFAQPPECIPDALRQALETANAKIFAEAQDNPAFHGMGTTVSSLVVAGPWAYIAQVGDSRIYLLRGRGHIHQLTRDHSLVAEQVRNGIISEEEARTHSLRNLITRAVGIKDDVSVDSFCVKLRAGDRLLLCSDGLSGLVPDRRIAQVLRGEDLAYETQYLVDKALEGGGPDNITALALHVVAPLPEAECQKGDAELVEIGEPSFFSRILGFFG